MGGLIVVGIFALLVITTIFMGVRLVPQGSKWVVQRLGKFHKTLNPGLNIIIPYIDNVAYKVTTKDQVLDIQSQEVITMDNAVILELGYSDLGAVAENHHLGPMNPDYVDIGAPVPDPAGAPATASSPATGSGALAISKVSGITCGCNIFSGVSASLISRLRTTEKLSNTTAAVDNCHSQWRFFR